jgi:hypothetical protein
MTRNTKGIIEITLLVMFYLSFLLYLAADLFRSTVNPIIGEVTAYIVLPILLFYSILASLTKISNLILFLVFMYVFSVLLNLTSSYKFYEFQSQDLGLIFYIFLIMFFKGLFKIKGNTFLKIILLVVILFSFLYLLFFAVTIFDVNAIDKYNKVINPLFLIATLAMIFGLPNSSYSEWIMDHRKVFIKSVLAVWILFFLISTSYFFIDKEKYNSLFMPGINEKWAMKDYKIDEKPGMKN